MKQEMMGWQQQWQWHLLDHMQIICISLQTDNHASTSPLSFTGRMLFLPPNQQRQSTEGRLFSFTTGHFCMRALCKEIFLLKN